MDHYNTRLVAQGYNQVQGIDYNETFSPVVKVTTILLILALAVTPKWTLRELNVKNIFFHRDLSEIIFMEQPPSFKDSQLPHFVCKLHKSIYGLKKAPRAWFDKLLKFLIHFGFICSNVDSSLFIFHNKSIIVIMLIYVDDIVVIGNNDQLV